jgi:hypothetical protein
LASRTAPTVKIKAAAVVTASPRETVIRRSRRSTAPKRRNITRAPVGSGWCGRDGRSDAISGGGNGAQRLCGGVGVGLGIVASNVISSTLRWPTLVPWGGLVIAVIFSAMVGIFFGDYPAHKAAPFGSDRRAALTKSDGHGKDDR